MMQVVVGSRMSSTPCTSSLASRVVIPWWVRRGVRKGLADWEASRKRLHPDPKRPKSLEWDPSDPGTNRGYVPSDGPEEN